ncbi:MAG: hypothetical protein RL068_26 [Actinomycetota bacterium]
MKSFTQEPSSNIVGYEAVRAASKDFETYSSALQGDRDVRDYPQLPLEVDPPKHTDYRHAIQPLFLRPKLESHKGEFEAIARKVFRDLDGKTGEIDVYLDIALPFVIGCLTVIYKRPQDYREWASWGPDVWTAASPERSGETLHNYLARVWQEESDPEDIWGYLKAIRPMQGDLTEIEFKGYASVLLAGGRDTVIKLVSGLMWHLMAVPEDLRKLVEDPSLDKPLINEMLRFLSPLPAIERINPAEFSPESPSYYRLHFASANHDPNIWDQPDLINLERGKQPHLAFGYGPHACIGMNLAEYEARAFLGVFVELAVDFELINFEVEWDEVDGIAFVKDLRNVKVKKGS